jgi:hypothetical protein
VKTLALFFLLAIACGDNQKGPISYTDPGAGKLRLIEGPSPGADRVLLQLVVGDQALTGYSVGFDLPIDDTKVTFARFTPGTALDPGTSPIAAVGKLMATGPLAHALVTAQSQKASGDGAKPADTTLAPGTVLYSFELVMINHAHGVVFDGTAPGFLLPSGGLRDRAGTAVVLASEVAIGKLEIAP